MTDSVEDLVRFAEGVAARAARGRLHRDDTDSIAGWIVAEVLRRPNVPEDKRRAWVSKSVCHRVWDACDAECRYEKRPDGWWNARASGVGTVAEIVTAWPEERVAIIDLWVVGYDVGEITRELGIPWRRVKQTIIDVRRELKGCA